MLRSFGLSAEGTNSAAIGRGKREWWGIIAKGTRVALQRGGDRRHGFFPMPPLYPGNASRSHGGIARIAGISPAFGIRTAVASSSDRFYVEDVLKYMELDGYFCGSACGDEVPASKPAPYLYQKALELCGVSAAESFAIEEIRIRARLRRRLRGFPASPTMRRKARQNSRSAPVFSKRNQCRKF